jgi:hypothetical protein
VNYGVRILQQVTEALVALDKTSHELFVLAMLDLATDPHGRGRAIEVHGSRTTRTLAMGSLGLIVYIVDDSQAVVEVADVLWLG